MPSDYDSQPYDDIGDADGEVAKALEDMPEQTAGVAFKIEGGKVALNWTAPTAPDVREIADYCLSFALP
ncbi:MAG: hypothetical protein IPG56_12765 [Caulobacteraceae bacterium]|nr:hypothetical protein [Caulobacteraceae bacterium]